jgi:hypothetical protein
VVRETDPDVAVKVIEYVPAGVPPVTGGVVLLDPHPACNNTRPKKALSSKADSILRFLLPNPISATPAIGINVAYSGPPELCSSAAAGFGRTTVFTCAVDVAAPLLRFGIVVVVNVQVPPLGSPELQESAIEFGMGPVGVNVSV